MYWKLRAKYFKDTSLSSLLAALKKILLNNPLILQTNLKDTPLSSLLATLKKILLNNPLILQRTWILNEPPGNQAFPETADRDVDYTQQPCMQYGNNALVISTNLHTSVQYKGGELQ